MSEGLHPGVHPDLDALNAFVESALTEHERVECLAHLAECAECREVVFLAQKAAEIEAPVAVTAPPVSFWQRLLRPRAVVSVIACALVAVFSFGVYRMTRSAEPQPQVTASTKAPVETAPMAKTEEQTPDCSRPSEDESASCAKEREQPAAAQAPVVVSAPATTPPPAPVAAAVQGADVAGVTGTIIDPAGAVIASARVELKNEDTGATYTSTSDARGQYSIAGLAAGRYDFSVTSPGFKKFVRSGIDVPPQEMARLDSRLDVGAASESVTVTAEAALLKTESGDLSRQADATSLNALPVMSGARGNFSAVTPATPRYTLPDKSTPVSVATKDKLVVAVNSAGALLVSENAGKNWTRVKATWKGKALAGDGANAMFAADHRSGVDLGEYRRPALVRIALYRTDSKKLKLFLQDSGRSPF